METRPVIAAALTAAAIVVGLTGCSVIGFGHPSAATRTPTPTPTPTAPAVAVPADCTTLVAGSPSAPAFTGMQVNDPTVLGGLPGGAITPTASPTTGTLTLRIRAATVLRCVWENPASNVTSISIEVARVSPDLGKEYMTQAAAATYAATSTVDGGQRVQRVTTDPQHGVQDGDTAFLRDGLLVHIQQANVPTNGLLDDIVGVLWP